MKPRHAPKSAASTTATFVSATMSAMTVIEAVEIADTPTARPSRPSIRFTAFVIATIQMIVIGYDHQPRFRYVMLEKTLGFATLSLIHI